MVHTRGSRGLMIESRTHNRKVASSSLAPAGIVGGRSECTALFPPSIPRRGALEKGTEPPTAPSAPQHKWLPTDPGVCSRCLCVHYCVCGHGWVNVGHNFWVWVPILGCTSLSLQRTMAIPWSLYISKRFIYIKSHTYICVIDKVHVKKYTINTTSLKKAH